MVTSELRPIATVISKSCKHVGTVFFFHGPGDTGPNFSKTIEKIVGDFSLPHIKFVFPTAPVRPYSLIDRKKTTIWFDKKEENIQEREDTVNITENSKRVKRLLAEEVKKGIPLNKIIVGGFSMGGNLALNLGYRCMSGLGGVFALSTYLNHNSSVYQALMVKVKQNSELDVKRFAPLFMAHGRKDVIVPVEWGKFTFDKLDVLNIKGEFITVPAAHELEEVELKRLITWINQVIPEKK